MTDASVPRTVADVREAAERVLEGRGVGNDAWHVADAWLTEHPDDDGKEADFDWLASQCERKQDAGYWDVPPSGDVWWEKGSLSFSCETIDHDQGEYEVAATDWQVDGQTLPNDLVPKTRGQFRRLVKLLTEPTP